MTIVDTAAPGAASASAFDFAIAGDGTVIPDTVPIDGTPGHVRVVGTLCSGKTTALHTLIEHRLRVTARDGAPLTQVVLCDPLDVAGHRDLGERVALFAGDIASLDEATGWLFYETKRRQRLLEWLNVPVLPVTAEEPHVVFALDSLSLARPEHRRLSAGVRGTLDNARWLNISVLVTCNTLTAEAAGGYEADALLRSGRTVLLRGAVPDAAPAGFGPGVGDRARLPLRPGCAFLVGFPCPADQAVRIQRFDGPAASHPAPAQSKIDLPADGRGRP